MFGFSMWFSWALVAVWWVMWGVVASYLWDEYKARTKNSGRHRAERIIINRVIGVRLRAKIREGDVGLMNLEAIQAKNWKDSA